MVLIAAALFVGTSDSEDGDDDDPPDEAAAVPSRPPIAPVTPAPPPTDVPGPSGNSDKAADEAEGTEDAETASATYSTFEATAYTARCDGCSGITKTGVDVRQTVKHAGKRVVAVDPAVIPLGAELEIRLADGQVFEATAQDVGGAIKGRRLDLLVKDRPTARAFGRQDVEVRVLKTKEGDGD